MLPEARLDWACRTAAWPTWRTGHGQRRSRIDALLALASTGRNGQRRPKEEKRAYRCPECKGWHLTSQPRPRKNPGQPG